MGDRSSDTVPTVVPGVSSVEGIDRFSILVGAGDGGRFAGAALRIRIGGAVAVSTGTAFAAELPLLDGTHSLLSVIAVVAVKVL